ncbi:MAG: DsbC family protein [Pseudomonadota bacterium]
MFKRTLVFAILIAFPFILHADNSAAIKKKLTETFPSHTPDSVSKSPVDGWYEVLYGTQVIYVSENGQYLMQGMLIDLDNDQRNLTEAAAGKARQSLMTEVNKQNPITFGAKDPKYTITIFTDIDCGYCRKLHAEMDQYASYGIKVNYLLYPRNGIDTPSYAKAVSVWCSDDQKEALTKAKRGETIEQKTCDNPVAEQFEVGNKIGVTGTPAILTENGELIAGYLPAKEMVKRLDHVYQAKAEQGS